MNKLGFVILYTPDVPRKIAFYERAFGMKKKAIVGDGVYGELEGPPPLGFAREDFAREGVAEFIPARAAGEPAGFEIGIVSEDVRGLRARRRGRLHAGVAAHREAVGPGRVGGAG